MSRIGQTPAQLDEHIDRLLHDRSGGEPQDEGELSATARLLRDALPRIHPRFTFEEHLATRLSSARRVLAGRPPAEGLAPIPLPAVTEVLPATPRGAPPAGSLQPRLVVVPPAPGATAGPDEHRRRSLVAGGAIASGVSLAGAALVVWRRSRSGGIF